MTSKRGWKFGLVGGVLGLVALVLPWAVFTASASGQYFTEGISPIQMLQEIQNSSSVSDNSTAAIPTDVVNRFVSAMNILLFGVIIYGIGCIVALVRPHGGFLILGGIIIAVFGTLTFGTRGVPYNGIVVNLSLGPGVGEGIAFIASFIAIAGVFAKDEERIEELPFREPFPVPLGGTAPSPSFPVAAPVCSSCGLVLPPASDYCGRCGAKVG